ncbi:hypothetical protein G6M50_20255 [Agrobacterium rhizogenes]|jgi:hypothetical protein|nr:hypothetical protein [Rhizobium rhizogenes]NTJ80122.1 hypothetical protein [Rhizobium rhizogenes]
MRFPQAVIFACAVSAISAISSGVWAAGFKDIVVSTKEGSDAAQNSFAPDTPKIFVSAHLTKDVPLWSDVNIAWIAVDTGGAAPPNYKIDSVDLHIGYMINSVKSAMTKPNNGWPVGSYEIVFSVNGKVMETTDFTIK